MEKWCQTKFGSNIKNPYGPSNSEDFNSISHDNIDPTSITNLNCRYQREILMNFQKWNAWAKTHKSIFKIRITWCDMVQILTCGFTNNLELLWERIHLNKSSE